MGIVNDNYLPMHQHRLNPSAIVDQKPWISFNIIGAEAYANGNFVYFPSDRLSPANSFETVDYNNSHDEMKGFVVGEFAGPSISMVLGKSSVALHTRARSYTAIDRIPAVVGQIITDESTDNIADGTYSITNGRGKTMSWAEVGLTYGRILWTNSRNRQMLNGAINVNRIYGIQQASFLINDGIMDVEEGRGTLRYAIGSYSYAEPEWKAGKGWGTNIGFTYKKMIDDVGGYIPHHQRGGCRRLNYRYKIGLSVIDIGKVHYKKNAFFAYIKNNTEVEELEDVVKDEDINSEKLDKEGLEYSAWLPTAAVLQFDYSLGYGYYLNATLLQNMTSPVKFGVERANLIAFTARYETKKLGFSVPFSLADYTEPQVGVSFRYGPFSIGSDHILPFLTVSDIYGADIYINFNLQLFSSPNCNEKGKGNIEKWICPVW